MLRPTSFEMHVVAQFKVTRSLQCWLFGNVKASKVFVWTDKPVCGPWDAVTSRGAYAPGREYCNIQS